jgi:hypothetical protein
MFTTNEPIAALPAAQLPPDLPLISILIPARNEERSIRRCVEAALAQEYPHCDVRVLDDHSTDATAAHVAALLGNPRLQLQRGADVPPGWAGKPHACWQLANAACGEWLLFLDADTAAGPALAHTLLTYAQQQQLDLVSVFPLLELESLAERLILPLFFTMLTAIYPFKRMEHPQSQPSDVFASGWCFLVRRDAYFAVGGHAAVRAEILEDVYLGQAIRAAGYRVGGVDAGEQLRLRMYRSAAEIVAGLGKNAAAGYRNGGARSRQVIGRMILQAYGPLWLLGLARMAPAPLAGGLRLIAILVCGISMLRWGWRYRQRYRLSGWYALGWPFGLLGYLLIAAYGMLRVRGGRGVMWKGRHYAG